MATIVSIHSFRGGTGKSNIAANLSTLLAMAGRRVGVIDTDIQSPGIHVLFGLDEARMTYSLNDYLWGKCRIEQTAHDVTPRPEAAAGCVLLIPSSIKAGEIARVLREGYDVGLLNDGINTLIGALRLDVLMIDTHPGLNEETLLSIAVSHVLVVVLRPDQQDYQGTGRHGRGGAQAGRAAPDAPRQQGAARLRRRGGPVASRDGVPGRRGRRAASLRRDDDPG